MTEGPPQVARVEPGEVSAALVTALHTGAVASRADVGVIALTGPGAVTCFQGLLTNDIELPGDGAFVYGALLTPKGMIVADGWAARLGATVSYTVPAVARESALNILTRSVPPRLARILAGWPRLGAEIDEKTIPQEVRLDEIGGVSYTKGCYTGQETVARLHFRGHVNRQVRGLLFDPEPPAAPAEGWSVVTHIDRDVGRVTSLAFVPDVGVAGAGRWIGLALVRREVPPGAVVRAAGRDARVVDLPFAFPIAAPA